VQAAERSNIENIAHFFAGAQPLFRSRVVTVEYDGTDALVFVVENGLAVFDLEGKGRMFGELTVRVDPVWQGEPGETAPPAETGDEFNGVLQFDEFLGVEEDAVFVEFQA
jgi:hypothetical protein